MTWTHLYLRGPHGDFCACCAVATFAFAAWPVVLVAAIDLVLEDARDFAMRRDYIAKMVRLMGSGRT